MRISDWSSDVCSSDLGDREMSSDHSGRRVPAVWPLVGVIAVIAALQAGPAAAQSSEMKQSGTVTVSQTQIAFIGSGNLGGGELTYEGKTHSFTIEIGRAHV